MTRPMIKPTPCACLGPMNGEPYCNCVMQQKQLPRSEGHIRQQKELATKVVKDLLPFLKRLKDK